MLLRALLPGDPWHLACKPEPGIDAYVVEREGQPVVMFLIIQAGLPEVHMAIRRGCASYLKRAAAILRAHLMMQHPEWKGVWTWVCSAKMERVAKRFGFRVAAIAPDGHIYLYHSFGRRTSPCP